MIDEIMEEIQKTDVEVFAGEEALERLTDGNRRFAASNFNHPNQSAERRAELQQGQNPFAVILGCSDSRVPPEVIFDQGLGDRIMYGSDSSIEGMKVAFQKLNWVCKISLARS